MTLQKLNIKIECSNEIFGLIFSEDKKKIEYLEDKILILENQLKYYEKIETDYNQKDLEDEEKEYNQKDEPLKPFKEEEYLREIDYNQKDSSLI